MRLSGKNIFVFDLNALVALDLETIIELEGATAHVATTEQTALDIVRGCTVLDCALVHHSSIGRNGRRVRCEVNRRKIPLISYSFVTSFAVMHGFGTLLERPSSPETIIQTIVASCTGAHDVR